MRQHARRAAAEHQPDPDREREDAERRHAPSLSLHVGGSFSFQVATRSSGGISREPFGDVNHTAGLRSTPTKYRSELTSGARCGCSCRHAEYDLQGKEICGSMAVLSV
jgi:hypothetical protein